jgi:hypothetical protein
VAAGSSALPAGQFSWPSQILPFKKVPVVITRHGEEII